jgi:hypothetical protein
MGTPSKTAWSASPLGLGQRGLLPILFDVIVFITIAAALWHSPTARADE